MGSARHDDPCAVDTEVSMPVIHERSGRTAHTAPPPQQRAFPIRRDSGGVDDITVFRCRAPSPPPHGKGGRQYCCVYEGERACGVASVVADWGTRRATCSYWPQARRAKDRVSAGDELYTAAVTRTVRDEAA
jgi:hypothetical protein